MRNQDTFANDYILTLFCSCYRIHVFINRSLAESNFKKKYVLVQIIFSYILG